MDMWEIIKEGIANIGFPILAFLLMYKSNEDMQENHKEEVAELTKVVDRNSDVIEKLVDRMDRV